ncbi:hypothetical protein M378DRAFT_163661 [Amanita muscaria Koide BX008]|uniref:Uncharacterized protein n=1 Tax=Amanita muscaria (strain Koide BX008) TaxID=946122 RepID=A0A0C2X621_AMAMK|nr:hypothetical protein M378DRAFT_163661 [Amanita muscaria Koide BX008]
MHMPWFGRVFILLFSFDFEDTFWRIALGVMTGGTNGANVAHSVLNGKGKENGSMFP